MDKALTGRASSRLPGDEDVFRAVGDATRRRLLQLLLQTEMNVSELVDVLRQPQSTVSRHLRVLRESGMVQDRRAGTISWYSARLPSPTDSAGESPVELSGILLRWLGGRPISAGLRGRLDRVLRQRQVAGTGFFNRLGRRWDDLRKAAFGEAFATEAFVSLLPREWTVADIGTGTGYLLPMLSEHFARVLAIDPAEAMVACARERVADHGVSNVSFHQGNLGSLPIDSESCDLALSILVVHHVEDPSAALGELHRVLRPGGRVLIVEQLSHENQAFYERMQDLWWGVAPDELCRQLTEAGFCHVRTRPLTTVTSASGATDAPGLFAMTGERAVG